MPKRKKATVVLDFSGTCLLATSAKTKDGRRITATSGIASFSCRPAKWMNPTRVLYHFGAYYSALKGRVDGPLPYQPPELVDPIYCPPASGELP